MSQATHRACAQVLAVLGAVAAILATAAAQEPPDELTPRAIADSTYAVRVRLDALAESIRRGQLDLRQFDQPEIAAAVARLASVAGARARRPPHPDLGVLWDLRIDIPRFQPTGQDGLVAQANVFLATERDSTSAPATLTFQRRGDRWDLVGHEGFAARLSEIAFRLSGGSGR